MSITAVVGGLILLALHRPLDAAWIRAPRPEAKAIFDALLRVHRPAPPTP